MTRRRLPALPILGAVVLLCALTPNVADAIGRRRNPPPPPPPPPPAVPDAAVVVAHTIPDAIDAGASANVAITVRNVGTSTWTKADGFKLGAVGDGNGDARRFAGGRFTLPDGAAIAPGDEHTFAFPITAPAAGSYDPAWQMVHENVRWFGEGATRRVVVSTPPAPPPPPPTPAVDWDAARRDALRKLDRRFRIDREDASVATPNLRLRHDHHEHYYQDKIAAIFGLVDLGAAPASRRSEANRLLRYQMFSPRFRTTTAGQLTGDSGRWAHRSRSLGMRLYMLFSRHMDADIKAEYHQRMDWMLRDAYRRSSENIKLTNNSSYFLSHEVRNATGRSSFRDVKGWLVGYLKGHGNEGTHEWGGPYSSWTFIAILNLAEFARDAEVRKLAEMVVDQYVARQLVMSVGGHVATASVRSYLHWTLNGTIRPNTDMNLLHFVQDGTDDHAWADFAISDWRPLRIHQEMFARSRGAAYSARFSDSAGGGGTRWRHHFHKGERFAIGTHRTVGQNGYRLPSGGTHDIVGAYVISAKEPSHHVVPYGHIPGSTPKKKRQVDERYFGYDNLALINNGGTTRAVWAGSATWTGIPARLFYARGFTREIQGGWAFLTDGEAFVAWAPSVGDPVDETTLNAVSDPNRDGRWLRSTHAPGDEGEMSVLEAGDRASFGSYAAFKADVLARNPRPRASGGLLRYVARDGAVLEMGRTFVRVNGVDFDQATHPRAEGPATAGLTIGTGQAAVTLDFDRGRTTGPLDRLPPRHRFRR